MTDAPMSAEGARAMAADLQNGKADEREIASTLRAYADLLDQSNMHNLHNTPDDVREELRKILWNWATFKFLENEPRQREMEDRIAALLTTSLQNPQTSPAPQED